MENKYPCQQLLGGTGDSIYMNIDGLCDHPECNPENDDRFNKKLVMIGIRRKGEKGFSTKIAQTVEKPLIQINSTRPNRRASSPTKTRLSRFPVMN